MVHTFSTTHRKSMLTSRSKNEFLRSLVEISGRAPPFAVSSYQTGVVALLRVR
jgi:hypothetical protein